MQPISEFNPAISADPVLLCIPQVINHKQYRGNHPGNRIAEHHRLHVIPPGNRRKKPQDAETADSSPRNQRGNQRISHSPKSSGKNLNADIGHKGGDQKPHHHNSYGNNLPVPGEEPEQNLPKGYDYDVDKKSKDCNSVPQRW